MKAYGEVEGVGALIIAARIEAGLTQRELAEKAGTSPAAIAKYETGRAEPRISTLERILSGAGMELRMSFAPIDAAEQALRNWEATLPPRVIGEWRAAQRRRVEADLATTRATR